jgi:hypothetical protein
MLTVHMDIKLKELHLVVNVAEILLEMLECVGEMP